jgi:uncharacterized metal-binding protein YceD (DUF177 family)
MRKRLVKMNRQGQETESKEAKNLPGYPLYPPDEDIYRQFKKEEDIDPRWAKLKQLLTDK